MAAQLIEHALLHIGAAPIVLEAVAQRVEDQSLRGKSVLKTRRAVSSSHQTRPSVTIDPTNAGRG